MSGQQKPIRLPAPIMPLLTEHDEYSMAHLIERHVEFFEEDRDGNRRSVALNPVFVRHYMKYRDSKLPVVTSISTLPMVLRNGELLAKKGLDRARGILFMLQPELLAVMPSPEDYGRDAAVVAAMRFLIDEWLCDVAATYADKCVLISAALTIIERALLAERPAFFVTAGQRGGGKTTTIQMIFLAATGYRAPAAAWSSQEEERRKCLFSYLGEGVPAVVWDNISRGSVISCPSIEKSLTAALYSDRILGQTGTRTVPATTINFFTGDNIAPKGDLSSRSLQVRLSVDQPDPENRAFTHDDPIRWTIDHRGNILNSFFTILLANPRLREKNPSTPPTRFKEWWHLVGSAVEHASRLHTKDSAERVAALAEDKPACQPEPVSFQNLFRLGEDTDQEASSLATVLSMLRGRYSSGEFTASQVNSTLADGTAEAIDLKACLEDATGGKQIMVMTPTAIAWRLKAIAEAPVAIDGSVFALRYVPDKNKNGGKFSVQAIPAR